MLSKQMEPLAWLKKDNEQATPLLNQFMFRESMQASENCPLQTTKVLLKPQFVKVDPVTKGNTRFAVVNSSVMPVKGRPGH